MADQGRVRVFGIRKAIEAPLLEAIGESTDLEIAESSEDDADLYLIDSCSYRSEDVLSEVEQAAAGRSVPRVVLSVPGADAAPVGSFPAEVAVREAAAIDVAAPWVVLRCAVFGQEFAWSYRYEAGGALYSAWQPGGAAWLDVADVVAVITKLSRSPDRWNSAYVLTGPAVVPSTEACELLTEVHERPLLYVPIDEDIHRQAMERAGFDAAYSRQRASYMFWTTGDGRTDATEVVPDALGRPATPLGSYLADAARAGLAVTT